MGATAMGYSTTANGHYSTSMGYDTQAMGSSSLAVGFESKATNAYSAAIGYRAIANGQYSTALGNLASTNSFSGSFIIGDKSTTADTVKNSANNQMVMRFAGGYELYTSANLSSMVCLPANGNSWGCISDSAKKENFRPVNPDYFLGSLSKLKLGSWNYKGQDSGNFRHYGPMAQEMYHYFGNDEVGTIGCDTTLNTADMDGIMMICLQALEHRTAELQKKNDELSASNQLLEKRLTVLEALLKENETFEERLELIEALVKNLPSSEITSQKVENGNR